MKGQSWCFDGSELVEMKPSLYRVFIKKAARSVDLEEIRNLAVKTLNLRRGEADTLCESLADQGEWVLGTYQADLAETIIQDLTIPMRLHGLELSISPIKE